MLSKTASEDAAALLPALKIAGMPQSDTKYPMRVTAALLGMCRESKAPALFPQLLARWGTGASTNGELKNRLEGNSFPPQPIWLWFLPCLR